MKNNLFRQEASRAQHSPFGAVLDVQGVSRRTVFILTITILILTAVLLSQGSYTRRNAVVGEVTTTVRPVNIFSQYQGYVSEVYVQTGDTILPGQRILRISTGRKSSNGDVGERNVEAILRQEEKIREIVEGLNKSQSRVLASLAEQRDRYSALYEKSRLLLTKTEEGLRTFEATLANYAEYQKRGLITRDQYIFQLNNFYQQQSMLNGINAQNAQEKMQVISIDADIDARRIEYQNQILENELRLRDLERQRSTTEAEADVFVVAPLSGRLDTVTTSVGQYVTFNDSLAQLMPDDSKGFRLILWVPDRSLPYIKTGDPISIRYDAFAWQKFGQFSGHITEISSIPSSPQEMSSWRSGPREELARSGGNYFRITCSLDDESFSYDGKLIPLSNGLTATVTLYLERRPLWQWLISPLYEVRKSVEGPS